MPPLFHRTRDRVTVPLRPRTVSADFRLSMVTGLAAITCFAVTGDLGSVHARELHARVIAFAGTSAFVALAALSVRSVGNEMYRVLHARVGPTHASAVRLLVTVVGALFTLVATLGLLAVPIGHLLLGGAITGVIVGIAAQQALGNVFAGLVLLLARPFNIGDVVRVRSGGLGGELTGAITGMGLAYVTMVTADGPLSVPNAVLLSAAVGPVDPLAVTSLDTEASLDG